MCINAHDPALTEVKPGGRPVCSACVSLYSRRRRIHSNGAYDTSNPIRREGAPSHGRHNS
jgi:hypothetical protein